MTDSAIQQLEARLKTVTARLESVEKQLASGGGGGGAAHASSSTGSSSGAAAGGGPSVAAFDNLISTFIDKYVELSAQIDPLVKQQADMVKAAVTAERQLLVTASQSKKPSQSDLPNILKPISEQIEKINEIRNKNRSSKVFNWLSTLSEGIGALGWVAIDPAPGPAVGDARASSEFYSNKILMEYKTKEGGDLQRNWVGAWNGFLKELQAFVKQYHTTGLTWNPSGGAASAAASSGPAVPSGGGPPAPPPSGPPPPDFSAPPTGGSSGKAVNRGALLSEINAVADRQKSGKTEGLRKVQAHEKTKNRDPNEQVAIVKASEPKITATRAGAKSTPAKPPRIELESNKWVVEWQQGNRGIVISETETRQTVYIYKCTGSTIQVKGKVNSIAIDGCVKTAIVFENAIASVEAVNCQSIEIQVLGKVPNISIDKTDGCQLHLSKECLAAEIITSKVSEMNISIPNPKGDHEDPLERPVPEQFKTQVKGSTLETVAVQHLG